MSNQFLTYLLYEKTGLERWEILKARIKKVSNDYARSVSSETKLVISNLLEKVNDYQSQESLSEEDIRILEATQEELNEKNVRKC